MATTTMSLKLLVDTKANKVLFAEAGKDFVDFLFGLLSLPVGAVLKLLKGRSSIGCIGNVYQGFGTLNESYMLPNINKGILLNPEVDTSVTNVPLLMPSSDTTNPKKFYTCNNCYSYMTDKHGYTCPSCRYSMTRELKCLPRDGVASVTANTTANGYVQGPAMYMVTDDLLVSPMSLVSGVAMLNKCSVFQLDVLEERVVEVGMEEGLELLKSSFESKAALTAVFLCKKEGSNDVKSFGTSADALEVEVLNEMEKE